MSTDAQSKIDYIPISIGDFLDGISVPVDLHVKLGEDKFVVIAKAGQKTQRSQLCSYQEKQVEYLWVLKSEYQKISRQNITLAGIVMNKESIRPEQKSAIIAAATQTVFTQLEHMGISLEVYYNAKQVTDATIGLVQSHRDLSTLIDSLGKSNDELLVHSLTVSALSVLIGLNMGWVKKLTLEKLALGGLLHDIGLKLLPPQILKIPYAQMTPEQVQAYETHPYRGMQMLQSLGVVPEDIVSIVYEHQENYLGQGYPQGIRDVKIHPLAKVVGLADQFVDLVTKNVNNPNPRNPREALMFLEHTLGIPFNREVFRALKAVVNGNGMMAAS
ncbi:MAG: HD domain-containing protein [Bdellovibrionales bacterium]|nr:HD domain-containing protein [Bdellovibrionales bacterium]